MAYINTPNELKHHGVEGMHWGERNYQYEDGSLTPLGRIHYGYGSTESFVSTQKYKLPSGTKTEYHKYKKPKGALSAKTDKWSRTDNQPSSVKSSILAGLAFTTGSETIHKALDKSNDKDAERWIRKHFEAGTPINAISEFETTLGKERVNEILTDLQKQKAS